MPSRADLAKIHIAKKELGLDDETYRDILRARCGGKESARDLTPLEAARVLEHFRALGWRPRRARSVRPAKGKLPLLRKVYALLGDRPAAYAEGILKRMYGPAAPARLEWASAEQLRKVVAALSYDQRRKEGKIWRGRRKEK